MKKKIKISGKGFIISLDALVALSILLSVLMLSSFYLGQAQYSAANSLILKENAADILSTLEKNGALEEAVATDKPAPIRSFLNKLPDSICADLSIYGSTDLNSAVMDVLRPGCRKNFTDSATLNGSFIVQEGSDANFYIARAMVWFRVVG